MAPVLSKQMMKVTMICKIKIDADNSLYFESEFKTTYHYPAILKTAELKTRTKEYMVTHFPNAGGWNLLHKNTYIYLVNGDYHDL